MGKCRFYGNAEYFVFQLLQCRILGMFGRSRPTRIVTLPSILSTAPVPPAFRPHSDWGKRGGRKKEGRKKSESLDWGLQSRNDCDSTNGRKLIWDVQQLGEGPFEMVVFSF